MDVPKNVLDLAVKVSKAANAEYWACDVAYGKDGKVRILECATAFAAFPYIRDWIGQYIMWSLSEGRFKKPHTPMFNWEELSKIDSSLLRTMRHITFGQYSQSSDDTYFGTKKKMYGKGEIYLHELDEVYKMFDVKERTFEEWPSEKWNYQDRFALKNIKSMKVPALKVEEAPEVSGDEATDIVIEISNEILENLLLSIKGLGKKKLSKILSRFSHEELVQTLEVEPRVLGDIKSIDAKLVKKIIEAWDSYKEKLKDTMVAQ
jgi:hypothetical protein